MPKSTTRARRTVQPRMGITLEERLFNAYEQFVLLADVFELQVVAPDYVEPSALSPPACRAVATLCRHGATDLRALLDTLPPVLKNWSCEHSDQSDHKLSHHVLWLDKRQAIRRGASATRRATLKRAQT